MRSLNLQSRRRSGFTLFELVVAMTMVSILAVTFYTTLHVCFRATEDATANIEPPRTAQLALDYVGDDLRNSLPPTGQFASSFEGTQSQSDVGGEADDVIFYSTSDGPNHVDGNGEIKQIELTVQTVGSDHVLVRNVLSNLLQENSTIPADQEILCRDVTAFTVQYFDGSSWYTTWDSTQENNTLPCAVKVALTLERPIAPNSTKTQSLRFSRTFLVPCSTAAQDPTVNSGDGSGGTDDSGDN